MMNDYRKHGTFILSELHQIEQRKLVICNNLEAAEACFAKWNKIRKWKEIAYNLTHINDVKYSIWLKQYHDN